MRSSGLAAIGGLWEGFSGVSGWLALDVGGITEGLVTGLGALGGGTFWATVGTEGDFHSGGTVKCDGLLLTGGGLF